MLDVPEGSVIDDDNDSPPRKKKKHTVRFGIMHVQVHRDVKDISYIKVIFVASSYKKTVFVSGFQFCIIYCNVLN